MIAFILLFAAEAAFAYYYFTNHIKYWEKRGIPGPKTDFFFGNLKDIMKKEQPRPLMLREWAKQYGDVFGYYEGHLQILVISDPALVQELFFTKYNDFYGRKNSPMVGNVDNDHRVNMFEARGNRWKRLRTIATPSFSNSSLKKIRNTVEDSTLVLMSFLEGKEGSSIDVVKYYHEYTMDVISRVAMGQKDCQIFNNKYIDQVLGVFERDLDTLPQYLAYSMPWAAKAVRLYLLTLGKITGRNPFVGLLDQVCKAVDERVKARDSGAAGEPEDFIDMFLDMKVEEVTDEGEFKKEKNQFSRVLTKQEVVAQCIVFLLAGFDTTANSLSYVTYEISKKPEVLKKLQEELDEHCTEESISFESLNELKYMDCVVKESLRMYPLGAFANSRECMVDTTLGDLKIEKGTFVAVDTWGLHYNKNIWGADAEEFKPERNKINFGWQVGDIKANHWISFGAGPRQCIGMRLAYLEEKMALAHILRKYNVNRGPKTEPQLKLHGCMTTSPSSVHVYLEKRSL